MILEYAPDQWNGHGRVHTDIAHDSDGIRYFKENGRWTNKGKKAKKLDALLSQFRRSDWGDRQGYHISGCPCNQYLVASCDSSCEAIQKMVYELGGFPDNFTKRRDENNRYTSTAENYG